LPLVATNGVPVQQNRTAGKSLMFHLFREHTHLDAAGNCSTQNSERHLKSEAKCANSFAICRKAIENTSRLAARLTFSLENLGYEFPEFPVPAGTRWILSCEQITWFGCAQRYAAISTR